MKRVVREPCAKHLSAYVLKCQHVFTAVFFQYSAVCLPSKSFCTIIFWDSDICENSLKVTLNLLRDKQVLWESAGAFFSARQLSFHAASRRHISRVRGLVVRCLLFNPEVSCSNPWVCAYFLTSIPKQKVLTFFGTMRFFGFVRLFSFEIF